MTDAKQRAWDKIAGPALRDSENMLSAEERQERRTFFDHGYRAGLEAAAKVAKDWPTCEHGREIAAKIRSLHA